MKNQPLHPRLLSRLEKVLNVLFPYEAIDGNGCVSDYLRRWTLLKLPGKRAVYLHHFVGSDWSTSMHDHPKRFISLGLAGAYVEQTPDGIKRWIAPWLRSFPPTHVHRLRIPPGGSCWTIVAVLKTEQPWGFYRNKLWWRWDLFVDTFGCGKSSRPDAADY